MKPRFLLHKGLPGLFLALVGIASDGFVMPAPGQDPLPAEPPPPARSVQPATPPSPPEKSKPVPDTKPSRQVPRSERLRPSSFAAQRPFVWQEWWETLCRSPFIHERLCLGTRVLHFTLKKDHQGVPFEGSFVGSIDTLEEVQDHLPDRFFVQYLLVPYLGAGVQRDRLEIKTISTQPTPDGRITDGNVVMRGFFPYLFARYPNPTRCTPFVEYGWARYQNSFDPDPDWYEEGRREFLLDSSSRANYWGAGVEFEITRHFRVDAYYRAMDIDVPGIYAFHGDNRDPAPFTFTMKHACYGIGGRMQF